MAQAVRSYMESSMKNSRFFWLSYIILLCLFLIRLIPFFFEDARLWGFNHLIFLPSGYTIAFAALSIIALILPFLKIAEPLGQSLTDHFSRLFFESGYKYVHRFVFVIAIGILFVLFAMPTHFLGDGYSIINNLTSLSGRFYKLEEMSVTFLLTQIQRILGGPGEKTALAAFRIVSIFSGLSAIWFMFLISGRQAFADGKRLLTFASLLLSGTLLLFFGYVENYPLLWPAFAGFLYFTIRYLESGRGASLSAIFLLAGICLHFQMFIFIPAFVLALFLCGRGKIIYEKHRRLIPILLSALSAGLVMLLIYKYTTNLYFEHIFLPLFRGKPIDPAYSIISLPHLLDIANQLLLLSPLLLIPVVASYSNRRSLRNDRIAMFLGLASLASIIFLILIDPKLGMARDWDLFSLSAIGLTLLAIRLIPDNYMETLSRISIPILVLLIISVLPYLLVNLNADRSVIYFEYLIKLDRKKSLPSLIVLRDYYKNLGNEQKRQSINARAYCEFPDMRRMELTHDAINSHDIRAADSLVREVAPDKFSANYHNMLSMLYLEKGEFRKAIEESDKILQLSGYNFVYYRNRGWIYTQFGRDKEALQHFMRAYYLNDIDARVIEGMAASFLRLNQLDSAAYYSKRLIMLDSNNISGYYLLARFYIQKKMPDSALVYARLYELYGGSDTLTAARASILYEVIRNLR